jgi:hypothetical protein
VPELCVYAIAARRAGRITVRGVAGETLQAIPVGRLDAIVGRVRAVPAPTARNLRRFDRMMTALWRRTPALLPARFGTAARDAGELQAMISDREQALRRRLRAVRNRAQMTVRMVQGSSVVQGNSVVGRTLSGAPAEANPSTGSGAHSGTRYLRARQREHAVPAFDALRASVRRWVRDERMEKRGGVASMYHLIPNGSTERYRAALEHAAHEEGLRVIVSGPWPPYAFAGTW